MHLTRSIRCFQAYLAAAFALSFFAVLWAARADTQPNPQAAAGGAFTGETFVWCFLALQQITKALSTIASSDPHPAAGAPRWYLALHYFCDAAFRIKLHQWWIPAPSTATSPSEPAAPYPVEDLRKVRPFLTVPPPSPDPNVMPDTDLMPHGAAAESAKFDISKSGCVQRGYLMVLGGCIACGLAAAWLTGCANPSNAPADRVLYQTIVTGDAGVDAALSGWKLDWQLRWSSLKTNNPSQRTALISEARSVGQKARLFDDAQRSVVVGAAAAGTNATPASIIVATQAARDQLLQFIADLKGTNSLAAPTP